MVTSRQQRRLEAQRKIIQHFESKIPYFTDIFDERTFYISFGCLCAACVVLVVVLSYCCRVTIQDAEELQTLRETRKRIRKRKLAEKLLRKKLAKAGIDSQKMESGKRKRLERMLDKLVNEDKAEEEEDLEDLVNSSCSNSNYNETSSSTNTTRYNKSSSAGDDFDEKEKEPFEKARPAGAGAEAFFTATTEAPTPSPSPSPTTTTTTTKTTTTTSPTINDMHLNYNPIGCETNIDDKKEPTTKYGNSSSSGELYHRDTAFQQKEKLLGEKL